MNENYSAGGLIEAWCPVCKVLSGHTIVDIADNERKRVKCNTCEEHHSFSSKILGKVHTKKKKSIRKSGTKEALFDKHLLRLTGGDPANSIKYNIRGNFEKDQIIDHIKFGLGIVLSVIQTNKIETLFKDGPRLLIQNQ